MIKTIVSLVMLIALEGCASLTYPLRKCDGYSRRPLNRAMWDWGDDSTLKRTHSDRRSSTSTTPYAEQGREPAAFAHLDIDGSHRRTAASGW